MYIQSGTILLFLSYVKKKKKKSIEPTLISFYLARKNEENAQQFIQTCKHP